MNEISSVVPAAWRPSGPREESVDGVGHWPDARRHLVHLRENTPTNRLLDVVHRNPGCNLEEVRLRAGLSRKRFELALEHLLEARRVALHVKGPSKHVLPFVPGIRECAQQVIVLRQAGIPEFHMWHFQNSPCTRTALMDYALGTLGWTERLARKRFGQLLESRIMRRVPPPMGEDQRVRWFKAIEAKEPAKLVLAALDGQVRFKRWIQHLCPHHR